MPTPSIRAKRAPPMAALWKEARIPAKKKTKKNKNKNKNEERKMRRFCDLA